MYLILAIIGMLLIAAVIVYFNIWLYNDDKEMFHCIFLFEIFIIGVILVFIAFIG